MPVADFARGGRGYSLKRLKPYGTEERTVAARRPRLVTRTRHTLSRWRTLVLIANKTHHQVHFYFLTIARGAAADRTAGQLGVARRARDGQEPRSGQIYRVCSRARGLAPACRHRTPRIPSCETRACSHPSSHGGGQG